MLRFLLFSAVFQACFADICVTKTLQFCQYGFNQNLNVTSGNADWTNPGTLSFIVRSYYVKGIDGLLAVCSARQQFAACLSDQYDACMSSLNFIASGESPEDADSYVQLFRTMEFDCDGGFLQSSKNWGCIAAILQTKDDQLNQCKVDYLKNEKNLEKCQNSAGYEACVRNLYSTTCGSEVSWWACERTRRALKDEQECLKNTCAIQIQKTSGGIGAPEYFKSNSRIGWVLRSIASKH